MGCICPVSDGESDGLKVKHFAVVTLRHSTEVVVLAGMKDFGPR